MKEFEFFNNGIEIFQEAAAKQAEKLILAELHKVKKLFPKHTVVFYTGMYSPYLEFTPALHGYTKIHDFDIEEIPTAKLLAFAGQAKFKKLHKALTRMNEIAIYTEDTFRRDLGRVDLRDKVLP